MPQPPILPAATHQSVPDKLPAVYHVAHRMFAGNARGDIMAEVGTFEFNCLTPA
jgi:hypothetical protein